MSPPGLDLFSCCLCESSRGLDALVPAHLRFVDSGGQDSAHREPVDSDDASAGREVDVSARELLGDNRTELLAHALDELLLRGLIFPKVDFLGIAVGSLDVVLTVLVIVDLEQLHKFLRTVRRQGIARVVHVEADHEALPEPGTRALDADALWGDVRDPRVLEDDILDGCARDCILRARNDAAEVRIALPSLFARVALGELRLFNHGHLLAKLSNFCTHEFIPVLSIVKTRTMMSNLLRQRLMVLVAHAHRVPDDGVEGIGLLLHLFFDSLSN